jgi:hypothetical protein
VEALTPKRDPFDCARTQNDGYWEVMNEPLSLDSVIAINAATFYTTEERVRPTKKMTNKCRKRLTVKPMTIFGRHHVIMIFLSESQFIAENAYFSLFLSIAKRRARLGRPIRYLL